MTATIRSRRNQRIPLPPPEHTDEGQEKRGEGHDAY